MSGVPDDIVGIITNIIDTPQTLSVSSTNGRQEPEKEKPNIRRSGTVTTTTASTPPVVPVGGGARRRCDGGTARHYSFSSGFFSGDVNKFVIMMRRDSLW